MIFSCGRIPAFTAGFLSGLLVTESQVHLPSSNHFSQGSLSGRLRSELGAATRYRLVACQQTDMLWQSVQSHQDNLQQVSPCDCSTSSLDRSRCAWVLKPICIHPALPMHVNQSSVQTFQTMDLQHTRLHVHHAATPSRLPERQAQRGKHNYTILTI